MKHSFKSFSGLRVFFVFWLTQSFSSLGSAMTSFALIVWSYQQEGSALVTALLSICSYAPYVLMSIFAGALSDRWDKRRTILFVDAFAALTTLAVFVLAKKDCLQIWHLYALNALNGLMNTVQQPAGVVAVSLLVPKERYQRVSGLQSFGNSLVTVLTPALATALLSFAGLYAVVAFDLLTCAVAIVALGFFIRIPAAPSAKKQGESLLQSVYSGLGYLGKHRGILDLILFLAAINFTASMYNAALPAMLLSRENGAEAVLGLVNACTGLATLAGSIFISLAPAPKRRVRTICFALLFSMSTENLLLALGRSAPVWCFAAILGWILIPVMGANMNALFIGYIPIDMQGRVFSARNSLQFFTIPLGYLAGGALVDRVFEPFMARQAEGSVLLQMLGSGKGSGAALLFLILELIGVMSCLIFLRDRHIWQLEP
ncbi:MAG TPA: MFS transporter [Clostridia bacterium]|nr:MFS transporter [Clostridia bacterium]